jgi:hypothetical protein
MERDIDLEIQIGRAIDQLEFSQRNLYADPKHVLKVVAPVEDSLQGIYLKIAEKIGMKIKK